MNWSDLLVVAIIAAFAVIGLKRGFIYSLFKLASFFVSIIISIQCYPLVAKLMMKTAVYTNIKKSIFNSLMSQKGQLTGAGDQAKNVAADTVVANLEMPGFMKDVLRNTLKSQFPDLGTLVDIQKIFDAISGVLAKVVIDVISLVVLYIAIRIGLIFLRFLLQGIAKLPVFKQVDKFGGLAIGAVEGLLTVYIVVAVIMLLHSSPQLKGAVEAIDNSLIAKFFYQHNFIVDWMFPSDKIV